METRNESYHRGGADRVRANKSLEVNARLDREIEKRVSDYATRSCDVAMYGMRKDELRLLPHDPQWRDAFEAEAKPAAAALGENVAAV